jgi:hypothetical protein
MAELIYHYTSINNLALILANRTLRLGCLENVDDMEECKADIYGNGSEYRKISKYFFVSSWTKEKRENIALWNMYTKNKGVRIGINANNVVFEEGIDKNIINIRDDSQNTIAFKMGDNYFEDVIYNDDLSPLIVNGNINKEIISKIGRRKHTIWDFQQESRFILCAMPETELEKNERYISQANKALSLSAGTPLQQMLSTEDIFEEQLIHNIFENNESDLKINYVDLELNESVWDGAEILLGFDTDEADKLIVKALIEKHIPNLHSKVKIKRSDLQIKKSLNNKS